MGLSVWQAGRSFKRRRLRAHRFNQHGPDGLVDIKPPGRLSEEHKEVLKQLVETGPDHETDGVVRWRRVDLKRSLANASGSICQR